MASPVFQQNRQASFPQRIALDTLLKYGALLSAIAYAAGYQIEANYYGMLRVPWDERDVPSLLYVGSFSVLAGMLGSVIASILRAGSRIRFLRSDLKGVLSFVSPGAVTLLVTASLWSVDAFPNVIRCVSSYLLASYLFAWSIEISDEDDRWQHAVSAVLFVLGLYALLWAASLQGTIQGQYTIRAEPNTRLILTTDSVEFQRQGLKRVQSADFFVSEPVTSIATRDSYYVILPNRTTIGIPKSKIMGVVKLRSF